jgi:hypothetical protein
VKDKDAAVGVGDLFDVDSEAEDLKEFLRHGDRVAEGLSPNDGARWGTDDPEQEVAASLVGHGDAVLEQPVVVELGLGLLEL